MSALRARLFSHRKKRALRARRRTLAEEGDRARSENLIGAGPTTARGWGGGCRGYVALAKSGRGRGSVGYRPRVPKRPRPRFPMDPRRPRLAGGLCRLVARRPAGVGSVLGWARLQARPSSASERTPCKYNVWDRQIGLSTLALCGALVLDLGSLWRSRSRPRLSVALSFSTSALCGALVLDLAALAPNSTRQIPH
jgi:hypothetical protein